MIALFFMSWLGFFVKITLFTFSLVLCFFLVLFGYKTADRGFDLVEGGRKVYGQIVFWGGIIGLIVVVPGSILFGSYWLIFEGGIVAVTKMFIGGLRQAAEAGEPVDFP